MVPKPLAKAIPCFSKAGIATFVAAKIEQPQRSAAM